MSIITFRLFYSSYDLPHTGLLIREPACLELRHPSFGIRYQKIMNGFKAGKQIFPADADSQEYALSLDKVDPLRGLRDEFIIPYKETLASNKMAEPGTEVSIVE